MPLIDPGSPAPDFTLSDQHATPHRLRDYRGKPVVLYFYPKDDTTGCTDQACQFRDDLPRFDTTGAVVLGVSPDSAKSHAKFAAKYDLPFTLLADEPVGVDKAKKLKGTPPVCDQYGVWTEKSMYGRKYMGVSRTTYLLDADGIVVRRWDKVSVPGHAEDVLAVVAELTGSPVPAPSSKKKPSPAKPAKKAGKKTATKKTTKKTGTRKAPSKASAKKKSIKSR